MKIFPFYCDLELTSKTSLPAHHAPVFYALLAKAFGLAAHTTSAMPDGVLFDVPEQARTSFQTGDRYRFGLTLIAPTSRDAAETLRLLQDGLAAVGREGKAMSSGLRGNFRLVEITNAVNSVAFDRRNPETVLCIPTTVFDSDVAQLQNTRSLTVNFLSPLRCELPKSVRTDRRGYMDARAFFPHVLLRRSVGRLKDLGLIERDVVVDENGVVLESNHLVWLDIGYGAAQKRKALGGAVGSVTIRLMSPALLRPLVMAQYVRTGEKLRWGFGAIRIAELGDHPFRPVRSRSLLELAFDSPQVSAAANACDVSSGVIRRRVQEILTGSYKPRKPRHYILPAKEMDARPRLLSVAHPEDRALQTAVLRQIAPALDIFLEESSMAYRQGLGRHKAAQRLRQAYQSGFEWAVRSDIHRFFDSVDHELLRQRLNAYLADGPMVELLMKWVTAGSPFHRRGLPTGSPLSPVLSNLFLDRFDEHVEAEGGFLVRYADDFLILFRSAAESQPVLESAAAAAAQLRLHLNQDKTSVLHLRQPFEFLGYRFHHEDVWQTEAGPVVRHINDLGWEQATKQQAVPEWPKLSGETDSPATSFSTTVIVGPGIEWIGVRRDKLVCRHREQQQELYFPVRRVEDLIVLGPTTIDVSLLSMRRQEPPGLWMTTVSGHLKSVMLHDGFLDNAAVLTAQVRASEDGQRCLEIARTLIVSKIYNYASLANAVPTKTGRKSQTTGHLLQLAQKAAAAADIDQLRGYEGAAAAAWYADLDQRLHKRFEFSRRIAPDADDPVNAMLNLGFVWLYRHMEVMLLKQGLSPALGFLHQPRSGHAALASDLMEPFRPLIERVVIFASHEFKRTDFYPSKGGRYQLEFHPAAMRRFVALIHESLVTGCRGFHQNEARPYRQHMLATVRSLHRHLVNPDNDFRTFRFPG
ncbi:MAG: CRISPR-associated endonuclease Cas1 [Planctomycetaceae bacterium]